MLECLAYGYVFGTAPALGTDLQVIFDCDCQDQVAHALYSMTKFRELCLSRLQGSAVNAGMLQLIIDDDEVIVVCSFGNWC